MKKHLLIILLISSYLFADSYKNGINFYKKAEYEEALKSFQIASNNDDSRAMLAIGIMYANGDGVKKDIAKSIQWYKKSAAANNEYALVKLGNLYASEKKFKQAFDYFHKAAKLGSEQAAYNLGYLYTGGLGVKRDLKKAFKWYETAAKAGNINAQINVGFTYIGGYGVKKDLKKAAYWIKKAKDTGNSKAITMWEQFHLKDYEK